MTRPLDIGLRPRLSGLSRILAAVGLGLALGAGAVGADGAAALTPMGGPSPATTLPDAPAGPAPAPAVEPASAFSPAPAPAPAAAAAVAANSLVVMVPADVLVDYRRWLSGRDPLAIKDFSGAGVRRDVVEVALMQQALRLGGCEDPVTFVEAPSYARELVELRSGHAALSGTSAWGSDLGTPEAGLDPSPAMIDSGDFICGCYTIPANAAAVQARNRGDLAKLRFVSCHDWSADWRALNVLAPAALDDVATWAAMPRLVAAGRDDVLLAPFQASPDLSLKVDGITLVPISGIAIAIAGSRHYATARTPAGRRAAAALTIGVPALRAQGVVRRAYEQSGFYNPAVIGWMRVVL
jgi:hypothetical protein